MNDYIGQLEYTNSLILKLVNDIKHYRNNNCIIIVLGDHGSRFFEKISDKEDEHYTILSSFYFPDHDYQALYDSISHVNIFRSIFRKYFGEDQARLPDKQDFVWPAGSRNK